MANVLDSLVIKFGLDGRDVAKGAKNVNDSLDRVEKKAQQTDATFLELGKTASDSFSHARNEALALLAVFTGGRSIKSFVSQTTQANAQLGYMAQRLNMNPQRLWAMQHAVMALGGSADEVGASFNSMQQMLTTPEGAGRLANIMGQLGVKNYLDAQGHIRQDILRLLNQSTQGMDQAKKNNLLGQLGVGPGEITLIDQTTKAFDNLVNSRVKLAPTNSEISNSERLSQDWAKFTDNADYLARVIENDVAPTLDKVLNWFIDVEEKSPDVAKHIAEITVALVALGAAGKALTITRAMSMLLFGGVGGAAGAVGLAVGAGALAIEQKHPHSISENFLQKHGFDNSFVRSYFNDKDVTNHNPNGNAQEALKILMGMGYTREQALGIVGNVAQESSFDPSKRGDHGTAFGLAQYHQDRADAVFRSTGVDVKTANFHDQIYAIGRDIQFGSNAWARNTRRALDANRQSIYGATSAVRQYYEAPKNALGNEDQLRYQRALDASRGSPLANTNSTEVHVGTINVQAPHGTNPDHFATEIHKSLSKTLPYTNAYGQQ